MSKNDLLAIIAAGTEAYVSSGGKVKQCTEGDQAIRISPRDLWRCECGCHGDFTDHSMRAGESGRCASVVVR